MQVNIINRKQLNELRWSLVYGWVEMSCFVWIFVDCSHFFNWFLSFIWPWHFVRTRLGWNCHFSHIEKMTGNIYSLFTKWIFLNFCKLLFVIAVQLKCFISTHSFNLNHMLIWALFCCAELITLYSFIQLHFSSGRMLSSSRRLHSFSVILSSPYTLHCSPGRTWIYLNNTLI